jgi:hypothetical protein
MSDRADKAKNAPTRGVFWHLKWLFACYAAAFGLFLLAFVVTLP